MFFSHLEDLLNVARFVEPIRLLDDVGTVDASFPDVRGTSCADGSVTDRLDVTRFEKSACEWEQRAQSPDRL